MEATLTFDLKMAVNLQRTLAIRSSVTMGLALVGIVLWAYVGVRRTLRHQLQDSLETTAEIQDHSLAAEGRLIPVRSSPDDALASAPPERVRRWLEGLHVEQRNLSDYDRLIAQLDEPEPLSPSTSDS